MQRPSRQHALLAAVFMAASLVFGPACAKEQDPARAESLFQQAMSIRNKDTTTTREQKLATSLLFEAAGLQPASTRLSAAGAGAAPAPAPAVSAAETPPPSQPALNGSGASAALPGYPQFQVAAGAHPGALRELGKAFEAGRGVEANQQLAVELLRAAAALGDPEAQGLMGTRLAFGLADADSMRSGSIARFGQPDEASALLHYYMGAAGGDTLSRLALGYRHAHGLGVPESCWAAVGYYTPVAKEVLQAAAGDGGLPLIERIRLNVHAGQGLKAERQREVLQYFQHSADQGDVMAQAAIGQVLNLGTHGMARDHAAAAHYLQRAAAAGDADAMAHLGHMHAAGLGVVQDYGEALQWFKQAAGKGSAAGLCGLGYMHLSGKGVPASPEQALKYLTQAADLGSADAHFHLGTMYLRSTGGRRRSLTKAFQSFALAATGNHLQAQFNAAMMQLQGQGTPRSCKPGLALLKRVAERGATAGMLQLAHEHFFKGRYTQALLLYLAAAEMGMELGASNSAWMLDRGYSHAGAAAAAVAFQLHRRSAQQGNIASLLLLGDSYFYGTGVAQDWVRSAAIYYEAYKERSPEAMFNLGFMHQYGAGVPQDLDLAGKFFDMTVHSMPDAALPVGLARAWLGLHRTWEWVRPGLPRGAAALLGRAFVIDAGAVAGGGPGASLVLGLMPKSLSLHWESLAGRVTDAAGAMLLAGGDWGDVADFSETFVLVLLAGVLWGVVRLRRQRQATAAQQRAAAAAAAVGVAGQPWRGGGGDASQPRAEVVGGAGDGGVGGAQLAPAWQRRLQQQQEAPSQRSPNSSGDQANAAVDRARSAAPASEPLNQQPSRPQRDSAVAPADRSIAENGSRDALEQEIEADE